MFNNTNIKTKREKEVDSRNKLGDQTRNDISVTVTENIRLYVQLLKQLR